MSSELQTDIWNRFISGDASCFEKIYKKYYREMYGYGVKICGDQGLVEDCIQELFKNIWSRRRELTHINSPNVYLFVSLRRKILNYPDEKMRMSKYNGDVSKRHITFGIEEIIVRMEVKKEQKKKLHEALNQLSDRQKEVVYLYFYNGMSYNEIAAIMSVNRQSVYNHMHKAMNTLRAFLEEKLVKLVIMMAVTVLPLV